MRARGGLAIVIGAALLGAPSGVRAQSPPPPPPQPTQATEPDALAQARACFERGRDAFQKGNYQEAIREFKAAQALQPSPLLDYNIGLAHEQLGHPRTAIKFLQRYLQGLPAAPNRSDVEIRIHALELRAQNDPRPAEPVDEPPFASQHDPYAAHAAPALAPVSDPTTPPAPRPRRPRRAAPARTDAPPAAH
jgi:tetratricopeptide (TPR) repeat protein